MKCYSKYDMVKVKVTIEEHFYILSRYMISRTLKMIKVKENDAIKIALEIKKHLVQNNLHTITHHDMEALIFDILKKHNYGTKYEERYKMISRFH